MGCRPIPIAHVYNINTTQVCAATVVGTNSWGVHTHCVAATYFIYYKMVYTTPPGKSKGRWNFDINDIYDITPSTIIGLLVRHHRETKMETHESLFFLTTFSKQTVTLQ